MDFGKLVMDLLSSPAGAAVITKFLMGFSHSKLVELDQSGLAQKYSKWLNPATVGLASVAALLSMAVQGHAQNFDPSTLVALVTAALVAHDWSGGKKDAK